MRYLDNDWCGLSWTDWVGFSESEKLKSIPKTTGLYRVKPVVENKLAYIGQTGRSLRERLVSGLVKNTLKNEMPFNDPHTAASSLWAWADAEGMGFELSAAQLDLPDQQRKAIESYLLWRYRIEAGESTMCNHGRFHRNYVKSRDRSTGFRGGRLPEEQLNPAGEKSSRPLQLQGKSVERNWMGLEWRQPYQFSSIDWGNVPVASGLYKLIDNAGNDVVYIGQTRNLRSRLRSHAKKTWDNLALGVSFVLLPKEISNYPFRMNEWENDLIGAYYEETGRSPRFQFVDAK